MGELVGELTVTFCGEKYELSEKDDFYVGRTGTLAIDDNPYLPARFLSITKLDGMWWVANIGSGLSASVRDSSGGMHAWLAPGAGLPLVFAQTRVAFTAGTTSYDFDIHLQSPAFVQSFPVQPEESRLAAPVEFTASQKAVIVALAEPLLRSDELAYSAVPSSGEAARRLGWTQTRFNRKLDNVCGKLDRSGVPGLRGAGGRPALNRRAKLVEHALMARLVTAEDLYLLDPPAQ